MKKSGGMEKAVEHTWSEHELIRLFEQANGLQYYVDAAEEGLADRKRGEAAHAECRCYTKSLFVLRALSRLALFVSQYGTKGMHGYEYQSLESVFRADDVCPAYLDAFEAYVKLFGDAWFDNAANRELFFQKIKDAFVEIVRQVGHWANHGVEKDRRLRFAIGFFLQEFENAATLESHAQRQKAVSELLKGFREVRALIEPLIAAAVETEKRLLKRYPLLSSVKLDGSKSLKYLSEDARQSGETLLKHCGDRRPPCTEDSRYDRIEGIAAILCEIPPSVMRFTECCRLLEESAMLASRYSFDRHYSSRDFVACLFATIWQHPKRETATSIAELSFTDDEKGQMSVAFKSMACALLRLRQKIKADVGFGKIDPEEYDAFLPLLPSQLGPETRDYRALLFEEGDASTNDGYNQRPVLMLLAASSTRTDCIPSRNSEKLNAEKATVVQTIRKAFASGSREVIDKTYDALVKRYFADDEKPAEEASPEEPVSALEGLMATAENGATAMSAIGKDYKYAYRFAYAPKFTTIVDIDHPCEPYCIAPYEKFTAVSVVEIIKTLLRAVGKKDGWVKCDPTWRLRFKDPPYKRFKDEQIEVGTKGNQHLGEWRIIPRDLFQELTKAPRVNKTTVGSVGAISKCGKSSHR